MVEVVNYSRGPYLEDQIEVLGKLPRTELVEAWRKQFNCDPPKGVKRGLLERAAGYGLQVKRGGGLKRDTHKSLLTVARGSQPTVSVFPPQKLVPGSRLVREWHGHTHCVEVTDDGFEWNGEQYSSLSAIACAITGTKWSGPRFFGVSS